MSDMATRVGVVGAGLMGSGIAEVCARAGCDVVVTESDAAAAAAGAARIRASLDRAVRSGKLSESDSTAAWKRVSVSADLGDHADRDLVIEAVPEDEELKARVFTALDRVVRDPEAILASNTSSVPIMKLGMMTSRPQHVIGIHFFNPVPVLKLVELVPSLLTSDKTAARAEQFTEGTLGKHAIRCPDRAGFVVNSLLVPFLLSAIRMLESGLASARDIDDGMVHGCAHPMGPLALADLIGLDTTRSIAHSLYEEFKEPLYAPPPLLSRMVDAGLLGRKSGRGFHEYAR
ncbi:3-hydroxybutyryl-CoA dehydrogenase [Streptomyces sp. MNU77]|uniref:3-hydroxybutyryl-CoA dehydrogenase n=1 Tax=Streptomyces sp. MNU77 TaxID=1573406 RepID=UPI0005E1B121|nr:3-hydroxybutyryl-CoA dehydrogenase [Streptomyces sp. MNU77]